MANIEGGRIELKDLFIKSICRTFNVNEQWLRTGEGEPYKTLEINDRVSKSAELLGRHDELFETLIDICHQLDDSDKKVILKVAQMFVDTYRASKKE